MTKLMKIKSLKNYGIPSPILNIWGKNCSPYLLPIQEEAVRNYGVLDYDEGSTRLPRRDAPRNDKKGVRNDNNNLLVIAPTSSGKTFIGEMAAITQVIHQKKVIYLVPLRSFAEEKYRHFKNLYSSYGIEMAVSTRDHREDDQRIIQGNYKIAVMVYEKFYYFLLKHPDFLIDVSLVVIDEMQLINNPKWGPLMENLIDHLRRKNGSLRIIALSALIENQEKLVKWFSAQSLISYQRPVKLRKGMVREGIFKYITSKKNKTYQREIFFKPDAVRDNCFADYLLETVRHFIKQNESTLIFFSTRAETRQWAKWLAARLESSTSSSAIGELSEMKETLSKDELLELLPKGIAYHNRDLSREERNLVETYLKKGEIKVICATNILAMGISLPFKNVIISLDKIHNGEEDDRYIHRTGLTFADIENMGGRAGILNMGKEGNYVRNGQKFGRVIFLAHSLFFETIYQKLYFNYLQNDNYYKPNKNPSSLQKTFRAAETSDRYSITPCTGNPLANLNNSSSTILAINHLVKKEKDLPTFLLSLLVNHKEQYSSNKMKQYLREIRATSFSHQSKPEEENNFSGYWKFDFDKDNMEKEIDYCLDILVKNKLIIEEKSGILSPTINGVLVIAKGIKVETNLYFKNWMRNSKKGEISDLELLIVLSLCKNGKDLSIPFSQSYRNDYERGRYNHEWDQEEIYWHRILGLIFNQGEGNKEIYRDKFILKEGEEETSTLEDYLSCKKILLLFDWIKGNKEMKNLEQEYFLYEGDILHLAEGFCWLADSLAAIVESGCWKKKRKEDLKKIILLSERLIEGIEEEGLNLARLYIRGVSRYYIKRLVKAGYTDGKCLREVGEEELAKILPKGVVKRIQEKIKEEKITQEVKKQKLITEDEKLIPCKEKYETENLNSNLKTKNQRAKTVLEISLNRPDRIIFMGEKIGVTATEFSLIHLLTQHNGQVMSYDELLEELWKGEEDAIYNRVSFHISKIRRNILKTIGERKINEEKVKDIFVVVPKRGVMLKLTAEEIKINK
jgi:helicase